MVSIVEQGTKFFYFFINNIWIFIFSEMSHQNPELIVGLSAFQTRDDAHYNFNIWNPITNTLQTVPWNTKTGIEMVS